MKFLTRLISTIFALAMSAAFATAAPVSATGPYYNSGSCALGQVSGGVIDCYGTVVGISNAQQVDVNNGTFYSGTTSASSYTTGLFGIQNWYDYAKASSGSIASFGQTAGTFTISHDLNTAVAVMLKAGNTWSAYLFNSLSAGTYTFDISGISQNALSNIRIISVVPVPAALGMMLMGLGGLALVRRRKAPEA